MNAPTIAEQILRILATSQEAGRLETLETLTRSLGVRRTDVRAAVSALDREGFVDALRMRPTLAGYALGKAVARSGRAKLRAQDAPVALVA